MQEIVRMLIVRRIAVEREIRGASEEEVRELERHLNIARLPQVYRDFLLTMGHEAGHFFRGTDMSYRHLFDLKQDAELLLTNSNETFQLPKDAIVFLMHQGYIFMYFRLSDGDDPPVYLYIEGEGPPKITNSSFSEFLIDAIDEHGPADRGFGHELL